MAKDKSHVTDSRLNMPTGVPAVKKGTTQPLDPAPVPEGQTPFTAPKLATRRETFWMAAGWGIFGWAGITGVGNARACEWAQKQRYDQRGQSVLEDGRRKRRAGLGRDGL